jgi:hypothetical protein
LSSSAGLGYAVIDLTLFILPSSYLHTKQLRILTTLNMDRSSICKQNLMHSGETSGGLSGRKQRSINIYFRCDVTTGRLNDFGVLRRIVFFRLHGQAVQLFTQRHCHAPGDLNLEKNHCKKLTSSCGFYTRVSLYVLQNNRTKGLLTLRHNL